MRILHLPSTFFPDHTGGKEVFVAAIIRNMPEAQHLVVIHNAQDVRTDYVFENINVRVLPLAASRNLRKSYYSLVYDDLSGFEDTLDEFRPDVVHFHDQSSHASLSHLQACKARFIKTILTYHSPGQSCLQRALTFVNEVPCDGTIDLTRCTYCRYRIRGVFPTAASIASRITLPIDAAGQFVLRNSTKLFDKSWKSFYHEIDLVQIHAKWVRDVLALNNVPDKKIIFVGMGGHDSIKKRPRTDRTPDMPLKLVFVGRCSDSKGIHLLIDAVKSLPDAAVEVHFFGPDWDDDYGRHLRETIKSDQRFKDPILLNPNDVVNELAEMDVSIVPSIWPETGPFTVFDAFAAALPVIGTRHAGIAERVTDNVNGLLFEWGNSADLADKISRLVNEPELLQKLRSNIVQNRTFKEMAADFSQLYDSLFKEAEG